MAELAGDRIRLHSSSQVSDLHVHNNMTKTKLTAKFQERMATLINIASDQVDSVASEVTLDDWKASG